MNEPDQYFSREWYTPRQVIRLLGLSKSTFWRRVHEGALVARQDGPKTYRINRRAILTYLEERQTFDPSK
ncbi:MAG: helix-turn-helix domain-containing protein [Thermodesulfobacteriota bacterium]